MSNGKKMRTDRPIVNGKGKYARILIKRKRLGTLPEESERLIGAGIDARTADLSVRRKSKVVVTDHRQHMLYPEEYAPSWSALRLLELLPPLVRVGEEDFHLAITPYGSPYDRKYLIGYCTEDSSAFQVNGRFFESIIDLIEQLAKAGVSFTER